MGLAQSIVWDAANLSYPLTREAQKLEAKATSELPVRYLLQDNSLATIDPDGYANLLKAGKTTLYADQPGNALFAPAPSKAVDLTVKRAKVEAIPTVPSIDEGDPVPAIHFTLKGLLFGESEQQLELPAYQIYHHGATAPVDLSKEQLKAGAYDLKRIAGTPEVVVRGNYEVKLSDGTLTVNAPKAKKLSVTVNDGEGQKVDGATVKVAGFTLTTASGKVELRLPASEYTVVASKDGYASDSKKIAMTADADASVELTLRKADISLTYTAGEHGSVIGYLTQRVAKGDNGQTVVAVPEENYMFDKWEDKPTEKAERTDMNVQANVVAKALFRPAEFTVRYLLDAELGELEGQAEQTVPINTSTTPVTVKPKAGVVFMGWSDGKMDLTRHEEGVKGNLTLTASLCRPYDLPYVENFERPTMPEFWRSEDKSPLEDGKKANGKFRIVAKGMADYELRIELDKLVHPKVHAVLLSPPIALAGVSNGLTLRYKAGWNNGYMWQAGEKQVGYRFDGMGSWTYADMEEDGKLSLESSALAGKKYVEFCWEIKVLDNPGLLTSVSIDNILVIEGSSTSKQVVRYIAGDHGKVKVGDDAPEATATRFVEQGKLVTVTAVPDAEYKLSTWSDGSKEVTRTDMVKTALTLQAFFEPDKPHFKLFYTADEHGRIKGMPLQEVVKGEDGRTVVAEPEEASAEDIENAKKQGKELKNYVFKGWSDGKAEQVRMDKNVQADLNVTAHFAPAINIVYEASIGGRVVGELLQVVAEGNSSAEVEAIPEEGYTFAGWNDGNTSTKRHDVATKDCTYRAIFNRKCRVTFSVMDGEHGSLTAMAGGNAVENGDLLDLHSLLTFTAHPDAGYRVLVWTNATPDADGDINTAKAEVLGDLDVKVQFVQYYTLTYASADEATGYIVGEKRMEIAKGLSAKPVTALSKINYQFTQWNDGLATATRREMRVEENKDFVASFTPTKPNLVNVTFRVMDSETGNPAKGAAITVGTASQNDSDNGHNGVVIVSLPKGTTAYSAASPGYKPKDSTVDVTSDGQEVAIRLEKEVVKDDKARDITFICTYNGEPVKGVTIKLNVPTLAFDPSAITDEDGKCVIEKVPVVDGDITWTATSGNYRTESGKFRLPLPNDEPIAISLTKLSDHGTLVFTCKDRASSAILKGVTITVKDAAGEHRGTTGADGQVKFEDILFGQVDYTAELNGYKKAEGQCPHAADGNAFEVQMEKKGGKLDAVISSLLQEVTVAPNPADSWIRVDNCQNVRHMAVYTATGARVMELVCGGQETVTINTALLTPGMYLLQLVASDGGRRSISFVKR
jgi:S-layer domain protein